MNLDVEAIERATLAAVPPQALETLEGWLLPLDDGTVGRAHSAVPTRHDTAEDWPVALIEARYRAKGLPAVFRLPHKSSFDSLRGTLAAAGYHADKPTSTLVASTDDVAALEGAAEVAFAPTPDDDWAAVFLGEGFNPADGASRRRILRRARESVFASVRLDGRVVAVGSACFSLGWCGVHGMRTAPGFRGRGFAASILGALGRQAQARGLSRAFLQVEQGNAPAGALYRRAGFGRAWSYDYWRRDA